MSSMLSAGAKEMDEGMRDQLAVIDCKEGTLLTPSRHRMSSIDPWIYLQPTDTAIA